MYPRRTAGKWTPISAGGWNASMRAAEDFEERLRSRLIDNDAGPDLNRTIVTVRNTTNNLMGRMSVLGLGDWTFDPETDESLNELHETLCVEGVAPVAGTHEEQFVVLPVDLDEKEIGPAVLYGLVVVKVNISDTTHKYCTIADGDTSMLKSVPSGRGRIIKAQSGTGTKYALVELGHAAGRAFYRGISAATLTKGGAAANVTRYKPGTTTSAGITDSVKNELATIASGKVVYYFDDGGTFYVHAAECPLT